MKTKLIDSFELFERFAEDRSAFDTQVLLQLDFFDHETNKHYASLINKYRNACGCNTGTVFMVVSGFIMVLVFVFNYGNVQDSLIKNSLYGLGFIVVCSLVGKLVGLAVARYKFKRVIRQIKRLYRRAG